MPSNFLKSFFMGTSIGFILINLFNYFAFNTEKFNFSPQKMARKAKLYVQTDSGGGGNTSKYVLWIRGKNFWDIHQSYSKWKPAIKIGQTKTNCRAHKKILFTKMLRTLFSYILKYKVSKKVDFTCLPLIIKIFIFFKLHMCHTFSRNLYFDNVF